MVPWVVEEAPYEVLLESESANKGLIVSKMCQKTFVLPEVLM